LLPSWHIGSIVPFVAEALLGLILKSMEADPNLCHGPSWADAPGLAGSEWTELVTRIRIPEDFDDLTPEFRRGAQTALS
jgi:hypothetical protein